MCKCFRAFFGKCESPLPAVLEAVLAVALVRLANFFSGGLCYRGRLRGRIVRCDETVIVGARDLTDDGTVLFSQLADHSPRDR